MCQILDSLPFPCYIQCMKTKAKSKPRYWRHEPYIHAGNVHLVRAITNVSSDGWFMEPEWANAPLRAKVGDFLEVRKGNRKVKGIITYIPPLHDGLVTRADMAHMDYSLSKAFELGG